MNEVSLEFMPSKHKTVRYFKSRYWKGQAWYYNLKAKRYQATIAALTAQLALADALADAVKEHTEEAHCNVYDATMRDALKSYLKGGANRETH